MWRWSLWLGVLLVPLTASAEALPNPRHLWDFGDAAASEVRFAEAAASAPSDAERLLYETQRARALGLQRRFDEARAVLDGVAAELGEGPSEVHAWHALEQGRVLRSSGDPDRSLAWFERSLAAAQAVGHDFLIVDAMHMLAIVVAGEAGLDWNLRAIEIARASEDPLAQNWLGSLLNNTGWSLHDLGRHDEALVLFRDAQAFHEAAGNEGPARIARWTVARCLRSLGDLDQAYGMQHQLLQEHAAAGTDDGYVHEELGELLLLRGDATAAGPHFAAAHARLVEDPWLVASEPDRLVRLAALGGVSP